MAVEGIDELTLQMVFPGRFWALPVMHSVHEVAPCEETLPGAHTCKQSSEETNNTASDEFKAEHGWLRGVRYRARHLTDGARRAASLARLQNTQFKQSVRNQSKPRMPMLKRRSMIQEPAAHRAQRGSDVAVERADAVAACSAGQAGGLSRGVLHRSPTRNGSGVVVLIDSRLT